MGALCSTGEGPTESLPRSLSPCEGGKNEMRYKPCWLLLLTGTTADIRMNLPNEKKKLLSEAALIHRVIQPAPMDQTQRLVASGCGYRPLRVQ